MTITQPTIWDNLHLEKGLYLLSKLQMDEAIEQFHLALKGYCELEDTHKAIEAAQYWKPRILTQPARPSSLLTDYTAYLFIPRLKNFRKGLLRFIAGSISDQAEVDFEQMETAFDLLLALKDYRKAEEFISFLIRQYPDRHDLYYFLAQAQWMKGNKGKANKNYILALLYASDKAFANRIKNEELKKLVLDFGPAMAPAYGWIRSIVPFVTCKNVIAACNEHHQKALKSYHILQQAHTCLKNNDTKTAIRYRKQLKAETPELYKAYFELLKKRK